MHFYVAVHYLVRDCTETIIIERDVPGRHGRWWQNGRKACLYSTKLWIGWPLSRRVVSLVIISVRGELEPAYVERINIIVFLPLVFERQPKSFCNIIACLCTVHVCTSILRLSTKQSDGICKSKIIRDSYSSTSGARNNVESYSYNL